MTLYEQIKKNFILPNAYEDWEDYRISLTNYIIRETNQVSLPLTFGANMTEDEVLPTLAILGAGACNDLDLLLLLPYFSKITLVDYDRASINTALETYGLIDCPYIECVTASLNGFDDSHYAYFCKTLQEYVQNNKDNLTCYDFEDFAISVLDKLWKDRSNHQIPLSPHGFDYICCIGVHSQLLAMFSYIYHAFEVNLGQLAYNNAKDFSTHFHRYLQAENDRFIPFFHDTLLSCATHAVFLGLERKRTNDNDAIEGAYQAIKDIHNRKLVLEEKNMVWPFLPSEDIQYEMSVFKITTY